MLHIFKKEVAGKVVQKVTMDRCAEVQREFTVVR